MRGLRFNVLWNPDRRQRNAKRCDLNLVRQLLADGWQERAWTAACISLVTPLVMTEVAVAVWLLSVVWAQTSQLTELHAACWVQKQGAWATGNASTTVHAKAIEARYAARHEQAAHPTACRCREVPPDC